MPTTAHFSFVVSLTASSQRALKAQFAVCWKVRVSLHRTSDATKARIAVFGENRLLVGATKARKFGENFSALFAANSDEKGENKDTNSFVDLCFASCHFSSVGETKVALRARFSRCKARRILTLNSSRGEKCRNAANSVASLALLCGKASRFVVDYKCTARFGELAFVGALLIKFAADGNCKQQSSARRSCKLRLFFGRRIKLELRDKTNAKSAQSFTTLRRDLLSIQFDLVFVNSVELCSTSALIASIEF